MREYLADQVIASAKRRGRIPDGAFTAAELLAIANEEMESYLSPLVSGAQEDYYCADYYISTKAIEFLDGALLDLVLDSPLYTVIQPTGDQTVYRLPARAQGSGLREVVFLDAAGNIIDVPRVSLTDLDKATWGVILQSQSIAYLNRSQRSDVVVMRIIFPLTPGILCAAGDAARVSSISGTTIGLEAIPAPENPLGSVNAPTSMSGLTSFDFIKATPGFEVAAYDRAGTCDGSTITLGAELPSTVEVGDYVAKAYYSPVPQCPTACLPLLAQSIAAACLVQLGHEDAEKALQVRALMEKQVKPLLINRIKGAPLQLISRTGVFHATRRW